MSRWSISARLAVVFALVMAIGLAGVGRYVYVRVGNDLAAALDLQLRARAQDLAPGVRRDRTLATTGQGLVVRGESFAQLIDAAGRVRDATATLGRTRLLSAAELERARHGPLFVDRPQVPGLDEPARMLAIPLAASGGPLVLVVGGTRENRAEALRSLQRGLIVGGLMALLLAAVAGYLLARSALRPVEAMRRRARRISSSSLDARLPVARGHDEIARLAATLNEMLDRLQAGVERERSFVANASHELRTPLALLKTELELARDHETTVDGLQRSLRAATQQSDRAARIADDLLVLARADGGLPLRREPIDVDDLFQTVAAQFASEPDARLQIGAGQPFVVHGDRLRLEQALGNLADNALRHGAGPVELAAIARADLVELHVRDAGAGFDPAFVPVAFDRFTRGDEARAREGTGLGLAIVQAIAAAHGGEAHIDATAGGGADVWFTVAAG